MAPTSKHPRQRLDLTLVERGLAESRERARALVMAGHVRIDGQVADRPAAPVRPGAEIAVDRPNTSGYVSRGGLKLQHALDRWGIAVAGQVALDVGASTGGFTDCLLQRGAARVYALDVGRGQLHHRLRGDRRVVVMERVNAHFPFDLPEQAGLATIDVSFISLAKVIPNVAPHVRPGGLLLCLVKPQFEAGRDQVGRGGVVRDPLVHGGVLGQLAVWAVQQGFRVRGITPSPVLGDKGNREFFLLLQREEGA